MAGSAYGYFRVSSGHASWGCLERGARARVQYGQPGPNETVQSQQYSGVLPIMQLDLAEVGTVRARRVHALPTPMSFSRTNMG